VGDINIKKPGSLDVRGKSRFEAWSAFKGMSKEEAKAKFVKLASD
jgi:diazepam-binding inhibitor (GABA receptor modulating acyl-CoA-binding protein)